MMKTLTDDILLEFHNIKPDSKYKGWAYYENDKLMAIGGVQWVDELPIVFSDIKEGMRPRSILRAASKGMIKIFQLELPEVYLYWTDNEPFVKRFGFRWNENKQLWVCKIQQFGVR